MSDAHLLADNIEKLDADMRELIERLHDLKMRVKVDQALQELTNSAKENDT